MIKNYIFRLLLVFTGLFSTVSMAQLVAADDTVNNINGVSGGFAYIGSNYFSILTNDTYNGNPLTSGQVVMTQISSTSPGVNVSGGFVYVTNGTPAGTYSVVYQICLTATPTTCDTATVTVNVCSQPTPGTTVVQPNCTTGLGSVTLTGLPAGTWTLSKKPYFEPIETITGTGSSFTFNGLEPNSYNFWVTSASGCISAQVTVNINGQQGIDAVLVGVYVDLNGNGVTDVGDVINYTLQVTNLLTCPVTNLEIIDASFNAIGSIASIAGNATDSSITGTYVLTQSDINAGTVNNYVFIGGDSPVGTVYDKAFSDFTLNIADGIKLNAFIDTNGNGIQDLGEENYPLGVFHYEMNDNGIIHNITTNNGTFIIYETNSANSFDVSFDINTSCSASFTISPSSYSNITVPAGSGMTVFNFPMTIVPCADLRVYVERRETARPGFTYSHWVEYQNLGNQTIPSGTITFTNDAAVITTAVSEAGAVLTPTGLTYGFTNLLPGEFRYFYVTMLVPPAPTVSIGDALTSTVSITLPPGDSNPVNNSSSITEIATNSLDPNDKSESHGGRILFSTFTANDYLTYTVNFENIGSANAINVKVTDVLNGDLDESSFQMLSASHNYVLDRTGSNLTWNFNAIELPPAGKGFVVFRIKPKPGFAIGDIIPNTASIYFDTNPAIVTNTVTTEFVSTLASPQFANNGFIVYPNPANSTINIDLDSESGIISLITVSDISGKTVLTEKPNTHHAAVDVSNLAKGIYFAKVTSAEKEKTVKIIKE